MNNPAQIFLNCLLFFLKMEAINFNGFQIYIDL